MLVARGESHTQWITRHIGISHNMQSISSITFHKSKVTFITISDSRTVTLIKQSLYCLFRFSDMVSFIFRWIWCSIHLFIAVTIYSSTLVRTNQKSKIRSEWLRWVETLIQRSIPRFRKFQWYPRGRYHLPLSDISVVLTKVNTTYLYKIFQRLE